MHTSDVGNWAKATLPVHCSVIIECILDSCASKEAQTPDER